MNFSVNNNFGAANRAGQTGSTFGSALNNAQKAMGNAGTPSFQGAPLPPAITARLSAAGYSPSGIADLQGRIKGSA